jgi:RNase H-fold protein (predicted Holliday junction resolvase)
MPYLLGFDPGRDKCGVAVIESCSDEASCQVEKYQVRQHQIFSASAVVDGLREICQQLPIMTVVMGDGTTTKEWQQKVRSIIAVPIVLVDERHSTLEARDRYWQIFPPLGLLKFVPQSLRPIDRPIDDIVAIILLERYLGNSVIT